MRVLNLILLILFPVAWFAPLIRAAVLPVFGMDEISVVTGLQSLWQTDAAFCDCRCPRALAARPLSAPGPAEGVPRAPRADCGPRPPTHPAPDA